MEVSGSNSKITLQQIRLEGFLFNIKSRISFIEMWNSTIQEGINELGEKAIEIIKKLNQLKEKLLETNKKLAEIKTKIVEFKHYEGKIKNFMCKNIGEQKKVECNTPIK